MRSPLALCGSRRLLDWICAEALRQMGATRQSPGLDERCRDEDGRIRLKKGDTRIDTLRYVYGSEFASGYRGDMHLATLLNRTGARSLAEYLKRSRQAGDQWPASVRALAGGWPDFPTAEEIRKRHADNARRERL
jgi:hypothetical protein